MHCFVRAALAAFPARIHFLDDGLTKEQLEGWRSLRSCKLKLKTSVDAGHKTWWRRDVLTTMVFTARALLDPARGIVQLHWCLHVVPVSDLDILLSGPMGHGYEHKSVHSQNHPHKPGWLNGLSAISFSEFKPCLTSQKHQQSQNAHKSLKFVGRLPFKVGWCI